MLSVMRQTAPSIFISYSSVDRDVADLTCVHLENSGFSCWIAPRDIPPGEIYAKAIIDAILQCPIMIVIFSASANKSHHVLREVERAVSNGRVVIIPFRIEDVHPSGALEYFLSSQHWLDAIEPPLEQHLENLQLRLESLFNMSDHTVQEIPSVLFTDLPLGKFDRQLNPSRSEEIPEFISACRDFLKDMQLDKRTVGDTAWVLWELLRNSAEHGCKFNPIMKIDVCCEVWRTRIVIQVQDSGAGFSSEDAIKELTEHYDVNQPRGRGLLIVRYLCQRISFTDSGRRVEAVLVVSKIQDNQKPEEWRPKRLIGDVVVLMVPEDANLASYRLGPDISMMLDLSYRKFAFDWALAYVSPSNTMTCFFLQELKKILALKGGVVFYNIDSRLYLLLKQLHFTDLFTVRYSLQDALAWLSEINIHP